LQHKKLDAQRLHPEKHPVLLRRLLLCRGEHQDFQKQQEGGSKSELRHENDEQHAPHSFCPPAANHHLLLAS